MSGSRRIRVIASLLVRSLPQDVRRALYADTQFCEEIGIETAATFALGKDVSVRSASLLDALAAAIDGRKSARLILADGKEERAKLGVDKQTSAVIYLGAGAFKFDDADLLSSKPDRRRKALKRVLKERPLLGQEEERWRKVISARRLSKDEFVELMSALEATPETLSKNIQKTLLEAFDPFSLLCGFELCRPRLEKNKSFERLGAEFLQRLFGDDAQLRRRCEIFSACAIVTTVTLRRTFDEASAPLFWFRLSALTHAGLLTDALRWVNDAPCFLKWVTDGVGTSFHWYGLYDRRDAPRWRPEWIIPEQIEAELLGRALNAVSLLPKSKYPKAWREIIDRFVARQRGHNRLVDSSFPGPLDDFGERPPAPKELQAVITEFEISLKAATNIAKVKGLTGLAYLANPSAVMTQELTRLLGTTLGGSPALDTLDACAHIAAGARSEPLARAAINQCLREVREATSSKAVARLYTIMLEACAAAGDRKAYSELVGEVSAALALAVPQAMPMIGIRSIFETLTYRDPKLLSPLSRASGQLEALEMRRS